MAIKFRIRPMQQDDIDAVYAIECMAHLAPWSHEILSDCVLVAYDCRVLEMMDELGVSLAGYLICRYHENSCHILNLCVAPVFQNKGYGRRLLQHLIDSTTGSEIDNLILEVRPSNASALHLYKKLGFEETGIKRGYYRDPHGIEDAIVLQKKIPS